MTTPPRPDLGPGGDRTHAALMNAAPPSLGAVLCRHEDTLADHEDRLTALDCRRHPTSGLRRPRPGVTHVAMRDVPPQTSCAASSVVNASGRSAPRSGSRCRHPGGDLRDLELEGSRGGFPAAIRADALRQAQNVAGARISAVAQRLGSDYRHPAAQSFLYGYHVAVGTAPPACSPPPSSPSSGSDSRPPPDP